MAESRVIETKLRPPRVTSPIIDRSRLTRRLEAHPGRVILVSASAGFGKTVLVVDWLERLAAPTAWLSLDALDNDPARFCAHLAGAVASLDVNGAARAAELIGRLTPPDLALPPALVSALAGMGREPVIVLDDVHEIRLPELMELIEALVQLPAPCPRLVMLTRIDPPFSTGRLRVAGELLEVRATDLRFSGEEAIELFERLLPGVLSADLVRRLDQRTEGWVAGLRLAAIALHDAADPASLIESFAGTHRFVTDYLLEEALERQRPDIQQFLLETSVLGRFSRDTCMVVTGDPEAAARLAQVAAAGLFLVPLGGDGEWYRYHHLFAELLRFRLRADQPDRLEELHRRASTWFEDDGDTAAALEHADQMSDQTRLLEVLDACVMDMLGRSELGALRHWTDRLNDPLLQPYPLVLCVIGWLRVVTDRHPDLDTIVSAIATALDNATPEYDPARRRRAALHIQVLTAYAARYAGRLDDALRIGEQVRPELTDDDPLTRGLLTYNMARVYMALADMAPAAELLDEAFGDHLRSGNLYLTLASLGRSAAVIAQTEGVHRAAESLAAAVAFAEERGIETNPAFSIVLYHRGCIEYLHDDLDGAERSFNAAVVLAGALDFPEERGNAFIGLARIAIARGSLDEAEEFLVRAAALGQGSNMDLGDTTIALERTRLAIARDLARSGPPLPLLLLDPHERTGAWTAPREAETAMAMWQALCAQSYGHAEPLIEELQRESEVRGRGPALCAALLARTLLPDAPDRWRSIDPALRMAATRGYVRPLLDGGEPVRSVLRAALTRSLSPAARAHARLVLERFEAGRSAGRTPSQDSGATALLTPLTDREHEVLGCLFRGQSNKAIAQSMFVSVDTAKTHLKRIYAKLGVTGRTQAVSRARELGLEPRLDA